MKNLLILTKYELKRIFRDRRLLLIVISQPFIIAIIVGLLAHQNPIDLKTAIIVQNPNAITEAYVEELEKDERLEVVDSGETSDIQKGNLRAIITVEGSEMGISELDIEQDPVLGPYRAVLKETALDAYNTTSEKLALGTELIPITARDASVTELQYFDYYASAIMVLLVLLVVLNIAGISITSEKASGTFERLAVTPYTKASIIGSKALSQFLIGFFVLGVGLASLYLIFDITLGDLAVLSALGVLIVMVAVALGLFISAITKSIAESVQLAMYVFFITFLTCGLNAPTETVHPLLLAFMLSTPFYYAVDAARRVNMLDAGWEDIWMNLAILFGFFIVFLVLSIVMLRKESK